MKLTEPLIKLCLAELTQQAAAKQRHKDYCDYLNLCDRYLTVMPDGSLYLCDNFSSSSAHHVGHITQGFEQIEKTEAISWLRQAMERTPATCTGCKYYQGCMGGCKHKRWVRDPGMALGHYYCLSTRLLYDHVGQYFAIEEK